MLRHKCMVQCARIAFGLSGIYEPDEAQRIRLDGGKSKKLENKPHQNKNQGTEALTQALSGTYK
jgi:hypothetical protein